MDPAKTEGGIQAESVLESDEQAKLAHTGRLHWFHWLIVGFSLVLTVSAWYFSRSQVEAAVRDRFDREAGRVTELVRERMELYENALFAGVAAVQSNGGDMSYAEWRTFSETLRLDRRYPGINGIGIVDHVSSADRDAYTSARHRDLPSFRIYPPHDEAELWPIRLVEPIELNAKAVGLDLAHETNRRTGAERARDLGQPQITGPITLVQDAAKTPGFLFYVPFYAGDAKPLSIEARRRDIRGLVYAPFIVNKLLEGTLRKESRHIRIRILDGDEVIYDEHLDSESDYDPNPVYETQTTQPFYGRTWAFDIASTKSFREDNHSDQPALILGGGLLIDGLLLGLFVALTNSNRRAVAFARRATQELWRRTQDLEQSNEALEKFAYVASHDLKTPLRGISDLADYLEEDLEEYLRAAEPDNKVKRNLDRLGVQVARMDGLIKGILDYSSLGNSETELAEIDLEELIGSTMRDLGCGDDRWVLTGSPRRLETDAIRLTQVVTNLLTNAVKHHDDPDRLFLSIEITESATAYRLAIADNGPGIDARFRERIFEVFQTLQSKDVLDSTGIGLAIVKKTVELMGGSISVTETDGGGATFIVEWPSRVQPL